MNRLMKPYQLQLSRHSKGIFGTLLQLVVLALFGEAIPSEERQALGKAIIAVKPETLPDRTSKRFGSGFGKPIFPALTANTTLADLVNTDSWWTVELLDLNLDFINEDDKEWNQHDAYVASKKIVVDGLNVVNDPAERAVKLTSDFAHAARHEDHFQNILQVVEADRKMRPN